MWYEFRPGEPEFARADTVGCASGVTFDEALTRALLEWVERDAMAIPVVQPDSPARPAASSPSTRTTSKTVRNGLRRE